MAGLVLAVGGPGCGDDDPGDARVETGAGIRLHLPSEARNLSWMRIELWNDHGTDPETQQVVDPPGCAEPAALRLLGAAPAQPDSCTRMNATVWDYLGRVVRTEPEVPYQGRAWGWNTETDDGVPVPSGYYFIHQDCLDSRNPFSFDGHYLVRREREYGRCEWPLWVHELSPGPGDRELAYAGFPPAAATTIIGLTGEQDVDVVFLNPFRLRIHAPGFEVFEREVTLTEYAYSDVDVDLTPLPGEGPYTSEER